MKRSIHPQAVPGEPAAVRWVTDVDLPVGRVVSAPGTLGPLLEYGVLTKAFVERGGVWTWLAPDHTWTEHGPRIRDAVSSAVDLPGWKVDEGSDELLGLIAREILDGELAGYVESHGGVITVAAAEGGRLTLDFGGACEDCPAASSTLHERIEAAVRERYPLLGGVERVGGAHHRSGGWLGLPVPGRGR
ncbi:NifU family protein [Tessaracoccus sp. MC1627]|uniref:NifU family protein n=1 Tax=Tessaracoccus sp. MC1627 TaxID=2760312 RepID=UPI0015FF5D7F|nr:NifU family protein [Tessaracoccus sp. MC1627]